MPRFPILASRTNWRYDWSFDKPLFETGCVRVIFCPRSVAVLSDRFFVGTVTKRLIAGGLAAAKVNLLTYVRAVLDRCELSTFVRAIAERLGLALATGAPPIVFAMLDVDCKWCVGGANGSCHGFASFG
jgi:hypothetical protein